MELFRISRERFAADLSGEGARIHGGRWNRHGVPMVYTSQHISLAAMEVLVHTPVSTIPTDLILVEIQIPDELEIETAEKRNLPQNRRDYPAPDALIELGTNWALEKRTPILKVPSAVIHWEWNFLINPGHEDSQKITVVKSEPFGFDGRLMEK